MERFRAALLLLGTVIAAGAVACGTASEEAASSDDALRPVERKLVGAPVPYDADRSLAAQKDLLARSMKARREVAWKAVARAIRPVEIADPALRVRKKATVPAFRTWYQKDDIERVFSRLYEKHGGDVGAIDEALAWNDREPWALVKFWDRRSLVDDQRAVDGLGGNARVSYSPGFVRHILRGHETAIASLDALDEKASLPRSEANHAPDLDSEFPVDAAVVKTTWHRAELDKSMPVYDTSAATLAKKRDGSSDEGGWGKGVRTGSPGEGAIYTVKLESGDAYRLAGLHLATKELREWLWITLFWSDDPSSDFGADRPAEIGGVWANYKMCVTVAKEENDPDPRGGYPKTGPLASLGDAIEAMHEGKGGPTWCSNPYIERGAKNAQTNCIGCHQHAGVPGLSSEAILADETRFPKAGRTKVRDTFPSDYTWAYDFPPEQLAPMMKVVADYYGSGTR